MSRDVVLDIIFTKMIGREYLAGVDCEWAALEDEATVARGLVTKGLVRKYAAALQRQDATTMAQVSKALDEVPIMKAVELWNLLSGQVQREVRRDERGRFTRNISSETSASLPSQGGKGGRQKGVATADEKLVRRISAQMQGNADESTAVTDPTLQGYNKKRGMKRAGQVRAIQRLQDELLELFGDDAGDDVVVIVETVPEAGQEPEVIGSLGLKDPVAMQSPDKPDAVLPENEDVPLQITYGIKQDAKPENRARFDTLGGLVDIGMRPESALAYASGKEGAAGKTPGMGMLEQGLTYGGRKKNTNKEKAQRHFATADKLGTVFTETGVPQLQSAGRALKATAAIGNAVPTDAYAMAERANYRYRGMKDNLPQTMTQAMKAPEHKMLMGAFSDPELTPEKWRKQLDQVGDYLQGLEARNKDVFNAEPYRAVLAAAIASTPANVSPRDFLDRYNRDLAIMALIPELPADSRAVKLGQEAGFGVPSSGVVIRPDGAFKEMYRGVGPDHYLPFSAKALPELRDGQYVRTRYRGGLTNEDVSVLVASGARKATVVSSSGMFSIELKPDTSAEGRMRSPEVAAMAERYERILDQVAASKIYMKDLDPQVKERLHNQAAKFTGKPFGDPAHEERFKALAERERAAQSQLSEDEIKTITDSVVEQAKAGTLSAEDAGRSTEMLIKEAISDARKEKVRAISLNAEGYGMALETLKLQYPSIIRRVSYEPLKDFVNDRGLKGAIDPATIALRNRPGGSDSGYVTPGKTSRETKAWSSERPAETPRTPGPTVTTTTTTPAAGGAAAPETPKRVGRASEVFGSLFEVRKEQVEAARAEAARAYPKDLGQNEADKQNLTFVEAHKNLKSFLAGALSTTDLKGPDIELDDAGNPGWLPFLGAADVAKAARDENGITLGMAVAFHPEVLDGNSALWEGDPHGEEARRAIDNVMSTALLEADIADAPLKRADKYGFYLPEDVRAAIPADGQVNVAETLAAVEQTAYDASTQEGARRAAVKAHLDKVLTAPGTGLNAAHPEDDKHLVHDQDVEGVQDLSVLGLLALQSRALSRLEEASWAQGNVSAGTRALISGLNGGDESAFYSKDDFDKAKTDLSVAVQEVIGAEFARRLLGGGDAGPKGLSRLAKSDRPLLTMLQSFLSDRALAKAAPSRL